LGDDYLASLRQFDRIFQDENPDALQSNDAMLERVGNLDPPPSEGDAAMLRAIVNQEFSPTRSKSAHTRAKSKWEQLKSELCPVPQQKIFFFASVTPAVPVKISAGGQMREYHVSRGVKYCLALKNYMPVEISLEPFYVANDGTESTENLRVLPRLGKGSILELESSLDEDEDQDGWRVRTQDGSVVLEIRYRAA